MKILLKGVKIVDTRSSHHLKKRDILIDDDKIVQISKEVIDRKAKEISLKNAHISPGWLDIGTQIGEPGFEHKETLETVSNAAAYGGYTSIASFPNTDPTIQTKADVQFIINSTMSSPVKFYPIGAVTKDCKGLEINEMIDMHRSGAIAFSDGFKSIKNPGVLMRALQYVKVFDGTIIQQATNGELVPEAFVHEGEISVRMGLKGLPSLAERLLVERETQLLEYAQSRLLIHNISAAESLTTFKKAKRNNPNLAASVSYFSLLFDDEMIKSFDPSYKVKPPLRSRSDRSQLLKAVKDGVISIITSNHNPQDLESKSLEFAHASFGNIGLETCFAALNTHLGDKIDLTTLISCLSINGKKFLDIESPYIEENETADLTLFDPKLKWIFTERDIKSKSQNTPFLDTELQGKVLGIYNKSQLSLI